MTGLGEQALSKAAEIGLQTQLDDAEALNVSLQTDPATLIGGKVNHVTVERKGLVMQQSLRTEALKVEVGEIQVNPWKAALGDIELEHPTEASVRILLTESDIDRAFNSQFIHEQIPSMTVVLDGQSVEVTAQQVSFQLPGDGKIAIEAILVDMDQQRVGAIAFTATPAIAENGHRIELKDMQYTDGEALSPELTDSILKNISSLLDLRHFEVPSMDLKLSALTVLAGQLGLIAEAEIKAFPGNGV